MKRLFARALRVILAMTQTGGDGVSTGEIELPVR